MAPWKKTLTAPTPVATATGVADPWSESVQAFPPIWSQQGNVPHQFSQPFANMRCSAVPFEVSSKRSRRPDPQETTAGVDTPLVPPKDSQLPLPGENVLPLSVL